MDYDLAIIGGGIGGYSAAVRACELNLKTVLIEKQKLGGTCLHAGCIPTKMLLKKAAFLSKAKKMSINASLELKELIEKKDQKVGQMAKGLEFLLKGRGLEIVKAKAVLKDRNTVQTDAKTIRAENIIIATGSSPAELKNIRPDHETVFNSDSILNLQKLPQSLAIIGGGYIGCEFAYFFNAMGCKVSLLEAKKSLLSLDDADINASYRKSLQKQGIEILTSCPIEKVTTDNNQAVLHTQEKNLEAEKVLLAVGRKLETENLGLEKILPSAASKGCIEVNENMQTEVPNIYAVGDVTGQMQLAHAALHQGIAAAENITGNRKKFSCLASPSVIFTSPEIASVGLTLQQALQKNPQAQEAVFPLSALGIAIALEETDGMVKIVFAEKEKTVLGAHLLGENVSFLISEMAMAVQNKLTLDQIADTIHPHPTLSEALFEAALVGKNRPLHMPKK